MDKRNGISEDEIREGLRKQVVGAMNHGHMLLIRMTNSAVDILPTWCQEGTFPVELFEPEIFAEEKVCEKLIKTKKEDQEFVGAPRKGFQVVVTSSFEKEDALDFLKEALPLDKLGIIEIDQTKF